MRLHTRLEEFGVPVQPRAKLNVTHKSEMGCDRARLDLRYCTSLHQKSKVEILVPSWSGSFDLLVHCRVYEAELERRSLLI